MTTAARSRTQKEEVEFVVGLGKKLLDLEHGNRIWTADDGTRTRLADMTAEQRHTLWDELHEKWGSDQLGRTGIGRSLHHLGAHLAPAGSR